jgi:hypothetical protein
MSGYRGGRTGTGRGWIRPTDRGGFWGAAVWVPRPGPGVNIEEQR